jgi:hypothetical protein
VLNVFMFRILMQIFVINNDTFRNKNNKYSRNLLKVLSLETFLFIYKRSYK